jgi:alkanesulfonate monooxygenase SsuD/methylene tetrahydromethanopterin reductase-like flavin-dependent oxidoreductase (luciferase family)
MTGDLPAKAEMCRRVAAAIPLRPRRFVAKENAVVELSVTVEGVFGLTWPSWRRLVRAVEDLGFSGLYLSDHFLLNDPPDCPSLELVVALTHLAGNTGRVRFGSMVAPLSIREPVMLARQAAALDDLSGGRLVLGVGAGWAEDEHTMFGYALPDVPARFDRLEEGLEVITCLLRSDSSVDFDGRFFRLRKAILPGPRRPGGLPVMVGGTGPRRTLPLVARYADVWSAQELSPDGVRERSAMLDGMLVAGGRRPIDVRRTMNAWVICGRTPGEFEDRLRGYRRYASLADLSLERLLEELRTGWQALVGTPGEVVNQIQAYAAAGISEFCIQWPGVDDTEGLEVLAAEVLPHLAPTAT